MNKHQFLMTLRKELASLPENEIRELIEDYEAHFTYGVQSGKTEEEISSELGNPRDIASDVYSDVHIAHPNKATIETLPRTIFSVIGLVFLNVMFALPMALAVWSVWLALCVSAIAGVASPLLAFINFIVLRSFSGLDLFSSLLLCGLGIFLALASYYMGKFLAKVTMAYIRWNRQVMKGDQ